VNRYRRSTTSGTSGVPGRQARRCRVCDQPLRPTDACPNTVCGFADRGFSGVRAVSEDSEEMWWVIRRYKYGGERNLAAVLGRLLVDFLEAHREDYARFDLITPSPNYVGPGAGRPFDHLRLVLEASARQAPEWPFAFEVVAKTAPSPRFLGKSPSERQSIAEGPLRAALTVPDRRRVAGRRVLVVDDVYSEGFTIRETARALRGAGARDVAEIVFTRRKGC
jgi:predicted amidophosphoribosyltransferase